MNKPQLSAEMEKRLLDLLPLGLDDWLVEDIKHFLATALEEEREKVLSEVEGWLVDVKEPKSGISDYVDDFARHSVNEYCAELRTKLNQLKGE